MYINAICTYFNMFKRLNDYKSKVSILSSEIMPIYNIREL